MMQLVIPAYNEAKRLPATLESLRVHLSRTGWVYGTVEVIVVDNASTDSTAAAAHAKSCPSMRVRVIHCAEPGKGAAVRAGMAVTETDVVGFMDADGATALDALDEAHRLLALGGHVAVGSRGLPDSVSMVRTSWLRERGARAYRGLAAKIVPGIRDTQCGFKVMDGDLARRVFAQLRTTGFSFDVEMLARMQLAGAHLVEFPVSWVDVPGSTFVPARHGASSFRELAEIAWALRSSRSTRREASVVRPLAESALTAVAEA